jgi:hypothetical protein
MSAPQSQESPYTPSATKEATQELLKYGLLEEARKPNLYRVALTRREEITRILEPLDLAVKIDEIRSLAFLVVIDAYSASGDESSPTDAPKDDAEDAWSHPLVRRQRLNLEQSLLIAILRQQFVVNEQEAGIGSAGTLVSIDDLLPQLQTYLGDMGSDALEQKRIRTLLEQLKVHGIVSEVDSHGELQIRPIIAHLANPENLQALLNAYRAERADKPAIKGET